MFTGYTTAVRETYFGVMLIHVRSYAFSAIYSIRMVTVIL